MRLSVGARVGRYELLEELGRGGMAVVFRALDPSLEREVALKVLHAHLWGDEEHARRFEREARSAAALRHPNVIEIFDYGRVEIETGTVGYIVVELIRGLTLREFVEQRGRVLPEVAALIGHVLLDALRAAHTAGIVHRDVKPDNVMIDGAGRLVLTDFGLARLAEGDKVTRTGALVGSPAYMAPEQARGEAVDRRTDLFAVGAVLYELCTGRPPFRAKDALATALKVIEGRFDPPSRLNPQVSRQLERWIIKMLAPAAQARYESAEQAQQALEQLLGAVGIDRPRELLKRFFAAPGETNGELVARIVEHTLDAAEGARSERRFAEALAHCDRVLTLAPGDARASALLATLSSHHGAQRRRWGLVLALVAAIGGALTFTFGGFSSDGEGRDGGVVAVDSGRELQPVQKAPLDMQNDAAAREMRARRDALVDGAPQRAPRPRPRPRLGVRPRRPRRDAGHAADHRVSLPAVPPPVVAKTGHLRIEIGPWCDASVDGRPVGRSPSKRAIELAPGEHRVVCSQPGGARRTEQVLIKAGQLTRLKGLLGGGVRVTPALKRGHALRVGGRVHRGGFTVPPRPARVELLDAGGRVLESAWISFGGKACTLADTPKLACR